MQERDAGSGHPGETNRYWVHNDAIRKAKPTWSQIEWGMWRTISRASTGLPTAKVIIDEKSGPHNEWGREPGDNGCGKRSRYFTSVFTHLTGLQESQTPETSGKLWIKEEVSLVAEDQVGEIEHTQVQGSSWGAPMSTEGAG